MTNEKSDFKVQLLNGKSLDLLRLIEKNNEAMKQFLVKDFKLIVERFKKLEARIDELSERKFCGVYQRAVSYKKNNLVTHSGGLWVAIKDTDEAPGIDNSWQLAVKKGDC